MLNVSVQPHSPLRQLLALPPMEVYPGTTPLHQVDLSPLPQTPRPFAAAPSPLLHVGLPLAAEHLKGRHYRYISRQELLSDDW